jgi:pilus assembly protein Flp/PilA
MKTLRRFVNNQSGATAIEYGLIAAGIAVAIITVVQTIGTNLNIKFQAISDGLSTGGSGGSGGSGG